MKQSLLLEQLTIPEHSYKLGTLQRLYRCVLPQFKRFKVQEPCDLSPVITPNMLRATPTLTRYEEGGHP